MSSEVMRQELIDSLMEQAQVFASAWALVGSRFDTGGGLIDANEQKDDLRKMITDILASDENKQINPQ